mgnify:CR=1 FL=1
MDNKVRKNSIYSLLKAFSQVVFPLITFPYISRVLHAENVGKVNFGNSIISYVSLAASLGITTYAVRECSKIKDDKNKLENMVGQIISLNMVTTFIAYIGLALALLAAKPLENYREMIIILSTTVLFTTLGADWLNTAMEDFKYITVRSLIIKVVSIVGLFIFVHDKSDLQAYAILSIVGTCGNNILNLIRINKYVKLRFSLVDCWKHTRGASTLFLGTIAVSLYTNLNSIMVGALGTMEAVGFFTTGNKIVGLVMTIITAVTSTIIPRMSYLVGSGKEEEAVLLQKKTINLLNYIALPMIAGLVILAKPIILVFSGKEFLPSVIVLQILSFLLIIIPWSSFLGLQILYPIRKEKYGNYAVVTGALVNLVLNFILIPRYSYIGVAISVVCAEMVITLVHYIFAMRYMKLKFHDFIPIKSIISTLVMALVVYKGFSYSDHIVCVVAWSMVGALVYVGALLLMRDKFMKEMIFKIIYR